MKVRALTYEDFLASKNLWEDALNRSLDNNIFLTWEWLSTWWKHYGKGKKLLLVTLLRNDKIVAAAPLMCSEYRIFGFRLSRIEFMASPSSDYHTFLLTEKNDDHVRLIVEYAKQGVSDWDSIELQDIPEDSETAKALVSLKERLGLNQRSNEQGAYLVVPSKFEDYFRRLSSKFRKNLKYYERRLERDFRVNFDIVTNPAMVNHVMKTFFDLHQKRWQTKKKPGVFRDRSSRNFHSDVALCFNRRGWLNLSVISLNDEVRAAKYAFTYEKKTYSYLDGFDPELSKYSIGNLLNMYAIRHCIAAGIEEYDLMRGTESYKFEWKTELRSNLEFWVSKRRILPMLYDAFTRNEILLGIGRKLGEHISLKSY